MADFPRSYAFSNLDDVSLSPCAILPGLNPRSIFFLQISWGTKQDSIVETDLGAVIQDSESQVDVEMFTEAADVNSMYEEALLNLKHRKAAAPRVPAVLGHAEEEQIAKDYYANVRTNVSFVCFFCLAVNIKCAIGVVELGVVQCELFCGCSKRDRLKFGSRDCSLWQSSVVLTPPARSAMTRPLTGQRGICYLSLALQRWPIQLYVFC